MFEDFKKAVLNFYEEKKLDGQLSDNLQHPTQAKLKKECLSILKWRYDKKDDETISAFFNPDKKFDNHEISIEKFDLDGFKALQKFFLGKVNIRKEESIKLLAWLIDFEPRPYRFAQKYPECKNSHKLVIAPSNEIKLPWKKITITSLLSILVIALGIYFYPSSADHSAKSTKLYASLPNKGTEVHQVNTTLTKDKQCMYWKDDHYEALPCNQQMENATLIPLDPQRLAQQKRITNLDTIGEKDIGRTWYFKVTRDSIELYTAEGSYPLDTTRVLKPLTFYMLNKYVLSKR